MDMIDSNQNNFMGYKDEKQERPSGVMNMDDFMAPGERERAKTYYQQVQRDAEERSCKFCDKQITAEEEANGGKTMIQSTECWHQVHVDCLKEATIKLRSEDQSVKCPKCQGVIQTYELNELLTKEELDQIEKAQQMQIVKVNENFVSC